MSILGRGAHFSHFSTVPGKAWLEFTIEGDRLIQTVHYYPNGLWGRLYWYVTSPFHNLVFPDLAEKIVEQARLIN